MRYCHHVRLWIFIVCLMGTAVGVSRTMAGVLTWGQDHLGQLGLNRSLYSTNPVIINDTGPLAGKQVTRVVDGNDHALALTADGLLFAWGDNDDGQLGSGNTRPENRPAPVSMAAFNGKTVVGIAAGWDFSLAWTSDGSVFAWGRSEAGQCGLFTPRVLTPRLINTGALTTRSVTKVVAGSYFALALMSTGELVAWGDNRFGQLGDGTTTNADIPLLVSEAPELSGLEIKEVAAGNFHSLAVASDGRIFSWGLNEFSQLGRAGNARMPGLVDMTGVLAGKKVQKVTASYSHTVALTEDGLLYAWGDNFDYTFLGNYTLTADTSQTPCAVRMDEFGTRRIVQVASGQNHNMALADDGTLYVWGYNYYGNFGNGNTVQMKVPVEAIPVGDREGRSISRLCEDVNGRFSHALTTDGKLLGWGADGFGQVGSGGNAWRTEPVDLMPPSGEPQTSVTATSRSPVLFASPLTGYQDTIVLSSTQSPQFTVSGRFAGIGGDHSQLAAGFDHMIMLGQDGVLYSYGDNFYGQLGNATSRPYFPTAVSLGPLAGKAIAQVCAAAKSSFALTIDGGIYAWGWNGNGQLGTGGASLSHVPVAVDMSGALAGKEPTALAAGDDHVLCITSDGGLYAWGMNDRGQLGDGTTESRVTPVEILRTGALTGKVFTKVWAGSTHSFALSADGTLFGWGSNDHGQLGLDTSPGAILSPTEIPVGGAMAGKTIQKIAAGRDFTLIICTDGSVFGMGDNRYGSLATGDRNDRHQPTALMATPLLNNRAVKDIGVCKSGYGVFAVTSTSGPDFSLRAWKKVYNSSYRRHDYLELFHDGRHEFGADDQDAYINEILIYNLSSTPLSVSNVTFAGPDAALFKLSTPVPAIIQKDVGALFSVTMPGTSSVWPPRRATLRFETNDQAHPVYEFPVALGQRQTSFVSPTDSIVNIDANEGFPIDLITQVSAPADSYTWSFDPWYAIPSSDAVISTRPSFHIPSATLHHAGTYTVVAHFAGASVFRQFVVKVLPTPLITSQPQSLAVAAGGTALFSVQATSSSGNITYQWFHDGKAIPGATAAALSRENAHPVMAGEYEVRLTNLIGTVSSQKAILTVTPGIPVTTGSFTEIAFAGEPVVLASGVYGAAPLAIQWSKSGKVIKGATGLTYSPAAKMSAAAMGSYSFTMANALVPTPQPGITGWLGMITRAPATASVVSGKGLSFTCTASSPPGTSLSYEWRKGGASLEGVEGVAGVSGRETKTLKISPASAATHAGAYVCHVTMTTPQGTVTRPHGSTTLTVIEVPSLAPASIVLPTVRVGQVISHQLVGVKSPVTYTATGLPPGITLNRSTGLLTGRPTAARFIKGENVPYKVRITVANTAGSTTTQDIEWLVLPPQELAVGQFCGLMAPDSTADVDAAPQTQFGGFLSLTLNNSGSSSGTVTLGAAKHNFSAIWKLSSVDASPMMDHTIVRRAPLASLILRLTLNPATGEMTGVLLVGSENALITAQRVTPNAAFTGWWNAEMRNAGATSSGIPQGASVGSINLTSTGQAQWTGKMADGTTTTAASGIGPTRDLPLYLPHSSGKGSLQAHTRLVSFYSWRGDGSWSKSAGAGGTNYIGGIPLHSIILIGEKYARPSIGTLLGYAETASNARIQLSGGSHPAPLQQIFTLLPSHKASMPANVNAMTLTFIPATGWFTGTFRSTDSPARAGTLHGLVFPGYQTGIGFFLQALPSSVDPQKPVKSGLVEIMANTP